MRIVAGRRGSPLAEAVLKHYDIPDDEADDIRDRIETAIRNSAAAGQAAIR